jgi:hypothetical protein
MEKISVSHQPSSAQFPGSGLSGVVSPRHARPIVSN